MFSDSNISIVQFEIDNVKSMLENAKTTKGTKEKQFLNKFENQKF